jgi:hypothetical protein
MSASNIVVSLRLIENHLTPSHSYYVTYEAEDIAVSAPLDAQVHRYELFSFRSIRRVFPKQYQLRFYREPVRNA